VPKDKNTEYQSCVIDGLAIKVGGTYDHDLVPAGAKVTGFDRGLYSVRIQLDNGGFLEMVNCPIVLYGKLKRDAARV
jgi:hypothetical protein